MSGKGKELEEQKEGILKPVGADLGSIIETHDIPLRHEVYLVGGHTGPIKAVAVTPDGRRLVTGSVDDTARLWDLETGRCLHIFAEHEGSVTSVAVTPDGRRLVTGSDDNTARLWDIDTGRPLRIFAGHESCVNAVAVTPDGRRLVTGSGDGTARLWDLETGRVLQIFQGANYVTSLAMTPDDRWLVTGSVNKLARLWDLETGELLVTMYNLKEGFLWTTPPTENAPAGWLWTDRFDLISVVERRKEDGGDPRPLADDDPRREAYLKTFNRREMVMDRLWVSKREIDEREKRLKKIITEGLKPGTRLPGPPLGPREGVERGRQG